MSTIFSKIVAGEAPADIVYSDERGEFEKFRPYGVPSDEFSSVLTK